LSAARRKARGQVKLRRCIAHKQRRNEETE
jgi:hypothetical protein